MLLILLSHSCHFAIFYYLIFFTVSSINLIKVFHILSFPFIFRCHSVCMCCSLFSVLFPSLSLRFFQPCVSLLYPLPIHLHATHFVQYLFSLFSYFFHSTTQVSSMPPLSILLVSLWLLPLTPLIPFPYVFPSYSLPPPPCYTVLHSVRPILTSTLRPIQSILPTVRFQPIPAPAPDFQVRIRLCLGAFSCVFLFCSVVRRQYLFLYTHSAPRLASTYASCKKLKKKSKRIITSAKVLSSARE